MILSPPSCLLFVVDHKDNQTIILLSFLSKMLGRVARSLRSSTAVAYSRATAAAWSSNGVVVDKPLQAPSLLRNTNAVQARSLSSAAGGMDPRIHRAYPQYSVHGESHMMSLKMIVPGYRLIKGESLVVDNKRKGRMLLEFTPRGSDGQYTWNDQTRFALSAEEVGLFCNQLPQFPVELSRSPNSSAPGEEATDPFAAMSNDMPDKVMKIAPAQGASVSFLIDFVKDGIGGQSPDLGQDGVSRSRV
jgi:hypothetical protein